jgi:hypothetical protein
VEVLNGPAAEIFTSGEPTKTVAKNWLDRYTEDNTASMMDLVNCILKCAGCELRVTEDDVNDPDNIASRVDDMQEEFKGVRLSSIFQPRMNSAYFSPAKYCRLSVDLKGQDQSCIQKLTDRFLRLPHVHYVRDWCFVR